MKMRPVTYVNCYGGPVVKSSDRTAPTPKPKSSAGASHRGWRVEGHPPGSLEAAKAKFDKAVHDWDSASPQAMREAIANGERRPDVWDEPQWRLTAKRSLIKITQTAIGAADVKRYAENHDWIEVRIVELSKGRPPEDQL